MQKKLAASQKQQNKNRSYKTHLFNTIIAPLENFSIPTNNDKFKVPTEIAFTKSQMKRTIY